MGFEDPGNRSFCSRSERNCCKKGVKEDRILSINFEDFQYASITDAQKFYEYICQKRTSDEKYYFFFDEIQMVEGFERVINSFRATWDVSIFITGSNAKTVVRGVGDVADGAICELLCHAFFIPGML